MTAAARIGNCSGFYGDRLTAMREMLTSPVTVTGLADAGAQLQPIGEIVRYGDLSGEQIDQAILSHVLEGTAEATDADPASTGTTG